MTKHYGAWHFNHPDLAEESSSAGPGLTARGGIKMVEGAQSVRQSILLLLSTSPGERVMRPDYGCNLHHLIFAPNDDTTAGLAIHYVRRALTQWEPRVEILALDAGRHETVPTLLDIFLEYRVRPLPHSERLVLSLNLAGENL